MLMEPKEKRKDRNLLSVRHLRIIPAVYQRLFRCTSAVTELQQYELTSADITLGGGESEQMSPAADTETLLS